jgi:hypothetical protein
MQDSPRTLKARLVGIDDLLRARPRVVVGSALGPRQIILIMIAFGFLYGAVMGSFGGVTGERFWQVVYSAMKVPLLLTLTFVISLPSFFIINTILGLRDDFAKSLRALVATQAALTVVLASFAPFTALWYASSSDYQLALLFNTLMFGSASLTAQLLLLRLYRPLIARNPRHRVMVRLWLVIYAFVGIQMGWVLRPFIGSPDVATTFFRQGAWGNAYVEVAGIIMRVLGW